MKLTMRMRTGQQIARTHRVTTLLVTISLGPNGCAIGIRAVNGIDGCFMDSIAEPIEPSNDRSRGICEYRHAAVGVRRVDGRSAFEAPWQEGSRASLRQVRRPG